MKKLLKIILWVFIITTVIAVFATMCSDSDNAKTDEEIKVEEAAKPGSEKTMAYIMLQKIVKPKFKNPKSVKFQKEWDGVKTYYSEEKDEYTISFWVEATNSFNATIRSHYVATIKKVDAEKWMLLDMTEIN